MFFLNTSTSFHPITASAHPITSLASGFQNRPSPETTKVPPCTGTFSSCKVLKTLCTKFAKYLEIWIDGVELTVGGL